MKKLIRGGRVWYEGRFHPGWDVLIHGSRIEQVGPGLQAPGAEVIDAEGHLVLPGFVNTHCHAAMTLLRSAADDMPLHEWLTERIWPLEARLTGEDVYWGTLLAIVEMVRSGITAFADMYFFNDDIGRAVEEAGVRAVLTPGIIEALGWERCVGWTRSAAEKWHGAADGRIRVMVGPHSVYGVPNHLRDVAALARELELPVHIHLSETKREVEECLAKHGKTPVAVAEEAGLFEGRALAAHCVHVTERDIDVLAQRGVAVAHNPASNMKLGSGRAPVAEMLDRGVVVGLATDGPASNNNLDFVEEARVAAYLAKLAGDPTQLPAPRVIEMMTSLGARAIGLDDGGVIAPGALADLVLIEARGPHWTPPHDDAANLIYAGKSADVRTVMVGGRIIMENRELRTLDEARIIAEAGRRGLALAAGA